MSNETQVNTELEAGAAPKSKFKKLILLILILLIAGGGAYGGYYFFFRKAAEADGTTKKSSKKSAEDSEEETSSKTSSELDESLLEDDEVKTIVELEPFIVNLADDDQARYLRMTVSLGVGEAEGGGEAKPDTIFITRVRNAMLIVLSDKRSEDVLTVKGKAQLRRELLKAAQAVSETPEVLAIYITDFIVQL